MRYGAKVRFRNQLMKWVVDVSNVGNMSAMFSYTGYKAPKWNIGDIVTGIFLTSLIYLICLIMLV